MSFQSFLLTRSSIVRQSREGSQRQVELSSFIDGVNGGSILEVLFIVVTREIRRSTINRGD